VVVVQTVAPTVLLIKLHNLVTLAHTVSEIMVVVQAGLVQVMVKLVEVVLVVQVLVILMVESVKQITTEQVQTYITQVVVQQAFTIRDIPLAKVVMEVEVTELTILQPLAGTVLLT
jgi:hypothetical protein